MVAQVRRQQAGLRVSAEARPRDQPTERSCRHRSHAGYRQRVFAPLRSRWRTWRSFAAISTIDAYRSWPSMNWTAANSREERRRVKTKSCPRADGLRRQNSGAPSSGHGCRTPCRSAVWAPPSRRADFTPMPLRRPDPLQRKRPALTISRTGSAQGSIAGTRWMARRKSPKMPQPTAVCGPSAFSWAAAQPAGFTASRISQRNAPTIAAAP